jgi:hypothetical protein
MDNNFFPIKIKQVPSKSEIETVLNKFILSEEYLPVEKFVILKAYEYLIKLGVEKLKNPAITSFLELKKGATTDILFGANVKITAERRDVTRKKYTYSDNVSAIECEIANLENDLKYKKDLLKLEQTKEINQGIAKEEIFEDTSTPQYGITVTLNK